MKRIREAKRALEGRAKAEAVAAGQPGDSAKPAPKAQYNFTDPESRIMEGPDGLVQAYNVQVAVDELQLIVGHAVTQETNDKKQLMPMIRTIEQQSGDTPDQLLADAGYCSDESLTAIADTTIDAYISTRKQKHGERPGPVPVVRCRRPRRSPIACPASCSRRPVRPSMPRAKDEAAAAGQPTESVTPNPKAQYNFTDPESRIMKGPDGFVQAYNVQVAVDELQLIVGQAVTQDTNDKKQLLPMITTIEQQSGDTPTELLADAGYCSDENLTAIADTEIDPFISTRKQKHGERPGPCPRGPLPKPATIVDRMSRKLHTKAGAAVYAARKGIVEPVIGQIKQARGFRQFLLRGFENVQGEWSLVCTTHNILKLYRLCL